MKLSFKLFAGAMVAGLAGGALGQFHVALNANASLSGNAAALAAFNRAAHNWETKFTDPVTININAGLAALGAGIIGSTSTNLVTFSNTSVVNSYTGMRNAMVADAADEATNAVVGFLPTVGQFSAFLPSGKSFGVFALARANGKALGVVAAGGVDATINFSTNFNFDYDDSDGIDAGKMSFETVATHEIGHALGFISGVDQFDTGGAAINARPLDLFRFTTGTNVSSAANFTNATRNFLPGGDTSFEDGTNSWRMSTGRNSGDGNQASHWKADDITGHNIGIMDPTLDFGQIEHITNADLRALDLIGYDLATPLPEPSTMVVLGIGMVAAFKRRKKQS